MGFMAQTPIDPSSLVMLAGVVLVVLMVIISTRRRAADRGSSPKSYAREQIARLRQQNQVREDLKELMICLEEMSRDINGQCDTRFAKLEKVIADADARIAELKRLGVERNARAANSTPTIIEMPRTDQLDETPRQPADMTSDGPATSAEQPTGQPTGQSTGQPTGQPTGQSSDEPDQPDVLRRQVLELAEAGKQPVEIARELGRDVGEVELIIKLHPGDDQP